MNKSFKERRKHIRIYRNFILTYHEKGKPGVKQDISQVNNVSKGGMNFSSTYPLKQGVVVIIDLKAPFITDSMSLEGLVLECREKASEIIYEIRVQFQKIPDQALIALEKIEIYSNAKEG